MDQTLTEDAPDAALLVAFANGDAAAGRALVARLGPKLFGHAFRVLGDRAEAEDVVQDAMIKLWKIAPDWRQGEAQVSTWAYRVVANLCTDRLRRRKTRAQVDIDAVAEPEADMLSAVEQMTEALAGRRDIGAIHVVSHGSDGSPSLGDSRLSAYNIERYLDHIAGWKDALADGADLLIYGCDFAASAQGREMDGSLSALTGADVAASSDKTGARSLG